MGKNVSEMLKVTKIVVTITEENEDGQYSDELKFKDLNELQQWITEKREFDMIGHKLHHAVEHASLYNCLSHPARRALWYILRILSEIINAENISHVIPNGNNFGVSVKKFMEVFRQKANEDNVLKEFLLKISSIELDEAMEELQRLTLINIRNDTIWIPYTELITTLFKNLHPACNFVFSQEQKSE